MGGRYGYLLLTQALILAEAVKSLRIATNQTVTVPNADVSSSLISFNQSLPSPNSSIDNRIDITCDGLRFGLSPDLDDCQSANQYITASDEEHTWVNRHIGPEQKAYPLPFRMMGNDARCYFQLVLKPGRSVGHASLRDLRTAASTLISQCITNARVSSGGIAVNIGSDQNMDMTLGEYLPKAVCGPAGTMPPGFRPQCGLILGDMLTSRQTEVFGPGSDPASEVITPAVVITPGAECVLAVYTPESSDSISWYKLWEEANAIYSICIRKGRKGLSRGLGASGKIQLSLGTGEPSTSNISQIAIE